MERLNVGRVKHDAESSTERGGREVLAELGTDEAAVSMWPGDLSPNHPNLGTLSLALAPVDERNLLAAVESGILGGSNTLDLDERGAGVGVTLAPLVRKVASLNV